MPAAVRARAGHPVGLASRRWLSGEGATAPTTRTPAAAVGPNPTDRGKDGSKRHVLTEGRGVPMATIVTAANVNDHTALPQLLDARIAIAPPRLERPGLCVDAGYDNAPTEERIAAADYTPHIRRRGEASPGHDPRVEPRRWPVERTHAWHNRFRRLLSAWCLVGDLGVIFLLVSGRWANDWVGFVAGGSGALFLGAVVVVFVTGISAYPHLELAHRELLHRITSFLQSAAGSSWAGPGRKLRVSAGAAWVRSATDSLRFEARMAIREYTYDGTDSSVRWSSDCVGKSGPIASACSESNTAHEFVQRRRQRRQATP